MTDMASGCVAYVFAGIPKFGIDGALRLETFQGEIVLHRIGDVPP
jgi:hypothetical protein